MTTTPGTGSPREHEPEDPSDAHDSGDQEVVPGEPGIDPDTPPEKLEPEVTGE